VTTAYINARTPTEVAQEVESRRKAGCRRFVLHRVDGGGMLDLERLGAARYAAGLQAVVELDGQSSPAGASVGTSDAAGAR
jgi:L-alanine-DL-glutamate epimerase-like enolase superfamily enzyme